MPQALGQGIGPYHVEDNRRDNAEPGPEEVGPKGYSGKAEAVIEQVERKDGD